MQRTIREYSHKQSSISRNTLNQLTFKCRLDQPSRGGLIERKMFSILHVISTQLILEHFRSLLIVCQITRKHLKKKTVYCIQKHTLDTRSKTESKLKNFA